MQTKLITKQESTQKMSEKRRREIEAEQLYDRWIQKKVNQHFIIAESRKFRTNNKSICTICVLSK